MGPTEFAPVLVMPAPRINAPSRSLARRRLANAAQHSVAARKALVQAIRLAHDAGMSWPAIAATVREQISAQVEEPQTVVSTEATYGG